MYSDYTQDRSKESHPLSPHARPSSSAQRGGLKKRYWHTVELNLITGTPPLTAGVTFEPTVGG
jgi:hypothetical protein